MIDFEINPAKIVHNAEKFFKKFDFFSCIFQN